MTSIVRWTIAASWLATAACGTRPLEPQPLPLDRVECARCRMMVSSLDHAAQAVTPGEDPRFYDDRGCLARDAASLPAGARLFVQLDRGAGWIDVRETFFAFPADVRTPMGYGVTAFRAEAAASGADRERRVRRWADVVRELESS